MIYGIAVGFGNWINGIGWAIMLVFWICPSVLSPLVLSVFIDDRMPYALEEIAWEGVPKYGRVIIYGMSQDEVIKAFKIGVEGLNISTGSAMEQAKNALHMQQHNPERVG